MSIIDVENTAGLSGKPATNVSTFAWRGVTVTVRDRITKSPKTLLDGVGGCAKPGELVALMGPSGSGKTTLLNVLARRTAATNAKVEGTILINGCNPSANLFRKVTSYVEQEDALIGSLTVRETISFSGRLALPGLSKVERESRVDHLIRSFGLQEQRDTIVGTPVMKGISGGQKRRLSVASQLMTCPQILFLDEPTSGLDSAASFEIISYLKKVAREENIIVIASIHQPSTTTFQMFDSILLLAAGKTSYYGPISRIETYFAAIGFPMPPHINPAEFILDLVNTDFIVDNDSKDSRLQMVHSGWMQSNGIAALNSSIETAVETKQNSLVGMTDDASGSSFMAIIWTLLSRLYIKSYRDVLMYGVRVAMYFGLAVMMGTVWLRLDNNQDSIQTLINAIFFGSAFMSFMAVAYVPAFLEDSAMYEKETANGLYGSAAFIVSNFFIGLPYLFLIATLFSIITYWLSNFRSSAVAFITYLMWLFLDLIAAESLVVLMSSLVPNFVGALALTAFANGLWMSVGGFLVPIKTLNVFYKYVFYYIDYQAYVFQGMMVNQFNGGTYSCDSSCHCMYPSELESQCMIPGQAVLDAYKYKLGRTRKWVGIMIGIIVGMRVLSWAVLKLKRRA